MSTGDTDIVGFRRKQYDDGLSCLMAQAGCPFQEA